jgi:hypothetical protein
MGADRRWGGRHWMQTSMNYELVFDVNEVGYRLWWLPAIGLVVMAVGLGLLIFRRGVFVFLVAGFAGVVILIACVATYRDYRQLSQALNSGNFVTVEGKVVDFVPMPEGGHALEQFTVNGHRFAYSDYQITAGFNHTQSHGGPIREGMTVRIADVGGQIARLEIARSSALKQPGQN